MDGRKGARAIFVATLIGVFAGTSCAVQHRATVTGHALQFKLPEIRRTGTTKVRVQVYEDGKFRRDQIMVMRADEPLHVDGGTVRLGDVAEACKPTEDPDRANPCLFDQWRDRRFTVREWTTREAPDLRATIAATVLLGPLVAGVTCGIVCDGDAGERMERAGAITLGSYGVLFAIGVVWMFVSCSGRWGQPGCRD